MGKGDYYDKCPNAKLKTDKEGGYDNQVINLERL
jgi:hypothetical protein